MPGSIIFVLGLLVVLLAAVVTGVVTALATRVRAAKHRAAVPQADAQA